MSSPAVYANRGRWIAQCECGEASECNAGDQVALCSVCRRGWTPEWPDDPAAIMRLLEPRPVEHQNWLPDETLADLEAENREHGIGVVA